MILVMSIFAQKKGGGGFDAYGIYVYFVNELETDL